MTTMTPVIRLVHAVLALAGCAMLLAAPRASAELVDIAWNESQRFERSLNVAPGKFAELCGPLRPGQNVDWRFDADVALNFNIHYHVGKDVVYPARSDAVRSLHGELQVTAAQDYCWMWTNKSATVVALRVGLSRK